MTAALARPMTNALARPKRTAFVLGAGGPVGHAFHAGMLRAVEVATGFDPRWARLIVGTSAGAQVAALVRAGMSTQDLYARALGEKMTPEGQAIAACFRRPDLRSSRRLGWPASPRYLVSALATPWRLRLGMLAAATLPEGQVDLGVMREGFRDHFSDVWPEDGLWVTAANLDTGRRVLFGRSDAPWTDVGSAVAASSSVPSLCRPVEIHGHRYVDGGMLCTNHADALDAADVEEIFISSPLSRFVGLRGAVRRCAAKLQATGRRVLCFEPNPTVAKAMGFNVMDPTRGPRVAKAVFEMTRAALTEEEVAAS